MTDPGAQSDRDSAPVLSIGEVLIDLIAADGATRLEDAASLDARPGGAPANVAVALARLGTPSAFCGVTGDDPFGLRLRTTLEAERVDVSRLRATNDAETTLAFAWKDASGDGHFRLLRMADRLLDLSDVNQAGIERCAAIVVGSVALAAEPSRAAVLRAVEIAVAEGVPVCFDVNLRPTLWPDRDTARAACQPIIEAATVLKLSLDDARFLLDDAGEPVRALDQLRQLRPPIVVLTDGARGCWHAASSNRGRATHVPAFAVDAIDPTGAGDAFVAALISRLLRRNWSNLDRSDLVYAAAAGALTTTRRGAMSALPTAAELATFVESHRHPNSGVVQAPGTKP